jgi:hypothetical protein
VRRFWELNLRVRGLPPSSIDPLPTGYSFLSEQLGVSDITFDKALFGHNGTLFLRFLSLVDRLQALRAKKKLFLLPKNIFLDENLTKSQVAEIKHSRSLVVEERSNEKWVVIRNLKIVIHDSPPNGWDARHTQAK